MVVLCLMNETCVLGVMILPVSVIFLLDFWNCFDNAVLFVFFPYFLPLIV